MNSDRDTPQVALGGWVAPFGDPGITDRSHLPRAFRSVPRPSSPLSAKASTRCPYLALDHRRFRNGRTQRLRRGNAAHHRRAQGQDPKRQAASHEDTSSDRSRSCGPCLSASVTSQLSLFTLQSTPASQGLRGCSRLRQNAAAHPHGGGERDRTDDLLLAKQALSQLSYTPGQRSEIKKTEISLF